MADPGGGSKDARPSVKILELFMQFLAKILPNNELVPLKDVHLMDWH